MNKSVSLTRAAVFAILHFKYSNCCRQYKFGKNVHSTQSLQACTAGTQHECSYSTPGSRKIFYNSLQYSYQFLMACLYAFHFWDSLATKFNVINMFAARILVQVHQGVIAYTTDILRLSEVHTPVSSSTEVMHARDVHPHLHTALIQSSCSEGYSSGPAPDIPTG